MFFYLGGTTGDLYKLNNANYFVISGKQIKSSHFPKLNLEFLTIHKAKGLGCDQCILVNAEESIYGFPSKVKDYPLIKLIRMGTEEPIDFAEERRLFYVALTRTKNKIYIVAPASRVSTFVEEISKYQNVLVHDLE